MSISILKPRLRETGVLLALLLSSLFLAVLTAADESDKVTSHGYEPEILDADDANELEDFLQEEIDTRIDTGWAYTPGIALEVMHQTQNGIRIVVRLSVWIGATCNLGYGSENKLPLSNIPPGVVPGLALLDAFNDHLFPEIVGLVNQGYLYGYAVYRGVAIDYFPLSTGMDGGPDNTNRRKDELLEIWDTVRRRDPSKAGNVSTGGHWLDMSALPQHTIYPAVTNDSSTAESAALHLRGAKRGLHNLSSSVEYNISSKPLGSLRNFSLGQMVQAENWPNDDKLNCMIMKTGLLSAVPPTDDGWWINKVPVWIASPNERFLLLMQKDCNLVLYDRSRKGYIGPNGEHNMGPAGELPIWASDTSDMGYENCEAVILADGVFGVYVPRVKFLWYSHRTRCPGATCWSDTVLQMQDDGNLVLYLINKIFKTPIWASNTELCVGGCY